MQIEVFKKCYHVLAGAFIAAAAFWTVASLHTDGLL